MNRRECSLPGVLLERSPPLPGMHLTRTHGATESTPSAIPGSGCPGTGDDPLHRLLDHSPDGSSPRSHNPGMNRAEGHRQTRDRTLSRIKGCTESLSEHRIIPRDASRSASLETTATKLFSGCPEVNRLAHADTCPFPQKCEGMARALKDAYGRLLNCSPRNRGADPPDALATIPLALFPPRIHRG